MSYRDPNLKETNQVFENVVKYLEEFDADDENNMNKMSSNYQRSGRARLVSSL